MDYVYNIFNNFKYFYNSMNPATLSGAIDVIVVEQPDGSYLSTPFHIRFGKWAVFNSDNKYVDIQINNDPIECLKMKLGENGVAFFVEEIDADEDVPEYLATSPLPGGSMDSDSEKTFEYQHKESPKKLLRKRVAAQKNERFKSKSKTAEEQKRLLPFSSSIFSCRKYRSLPDLTFIAQNTENSSAQTTQTRTSQQRRHGHQRKLTSGNIDATGLDRPISHSKSAVLKVDDPVINRKDSRPSAQKEKKVKFNDSDTDTSTTDDEMHKPQSPKQSISRPLSDIADGALSDSEIDRQRYDSGGDEPVWKWGELPETGKKRKQSKVTTEDGGSKGRSSWGWFRWRSSEPQKPEEGVYLTQLVNKDPNQLEKYFGTSAGSQTSYVDSGNGVSTAASPNSPSALSVSSLTDDPPSTATEKSPSDKSEKTTPSKMSSEEMATSMKKADAIEKTLLAGAEDTQTAPASTPELPNVVPLRTKSRSMSGTSVTSDLSSADEEVALYMKEDGRKVRYKRTLRLQSEQLKSLRLQYGSNDARFSVTTSLQGTAWCSCHIYLLKWCERIVISDIDGTITRSDVLGHVIPAIGGTWAHAGVAELYTRIKNNGYRLVYLSSRAIGQSHYTKTYLQSVAQGSKMLPDGPVLLSPTSVLTAFRKEVIERRPEEFKIACLSDIKSLFPVKQPFYAGFGNRDTDVTSYVSVGIPPERILIINPQGILKRADKIGYESSYSSMAMETVDYLFPPLMRPEFVLAATAEEEARVQRSKLKPNFAKPEYSTFSHWRVRPDDTDVDMETYETRRKNTIEKNKFEGGRRK